MMGIMKSLVFGFIILSFISSAVSQVGQIYCRGKPHCNPKVGRCMASSDWIFCKETIDFSGCHGPFCACCKKGVCKQEPSCADSKGYCFEESSGHVCDGTVVDEGCGSPSCKCCATEPVGCMATSECANCYADAEDCPRGYEPTGECGTGCKCCTPVRKTV